MILEKETSKFMFKLDFNRDCNNFKKHIYWNSLFYYDIIKPPEVSNVLGETKFLLHSSYRYSFLFHWKSKCSYMYQYNKLEFSLR